MQTDAKFLARRDEIKEEIEAEITSMISAQEKKDVLRAGLQYSERINEGDGSSAGMNQFVEAKEESDEKGTSSDQECTDDENVNSREQKDTLRVGIYCAMGRHRSVAMVEELASLSWPGWRVEVEHRDIAKKRRAGKKSGGRNSRGSRGGTISTQSDDDNSE
jgi:hypothetical protein